jgi:hypothetical protein
LRAPLLDLIQPLAGVWQRKTIHPFIQGPQNLAHVSVDCEIRTDSGILEFGGINIDANYAAIGHKVIDPSTCLPNVKTRAQYKQQVGSVNGFARVLVTRVSMETER